MWIYETGKDWILAGMRGRFGRKLDFGSNRQISALNVVLYIQQIHNFLVFMKGEFSMFYSLIAFNWNWPKFYGEDDSM